ncbi:MAG: metallophosphoesterase, partial [Chloroflexota bacterium]
LILAVSASHAEKFMIAAIPDTQNEVVYNGSPFPFTNRMDWLARNKTALNLKFVGHVGDLVNWDTKDHMQWWHASSGFKLIEAAGIPYAIALGNHDTAATTIGGGAAPGNAHSNLRNTSTFNAFFPLSRFTAMQGVYEEGKADNTYHVFNAGGLNWLVITLEFDPRQGAVEWAKTIVKNHPNHNVIIFIHNYLNRDSSYKGPSGYGDLSGQQVRDQLVKKYNNIKMVFCGHAGGVSRRDDVGVNGNRVCEMLFDMANAPNKGWTRLVEIDTSDRTISVKTYSPHVDQYLTDSANQFTFIDVNLVAPASTSPPPPK